MENTAHHEENSHGIISPVRSFIYLMNLGNAHNNPHGTQHNAVCKFNKPNFRMHAHEQHWVLVIYSLHQSTKLDRDYIFTPGFFLYSKSYGKIWTTFYGEVAHDLWILPLNYGGDPDMPSGFSIRNMNSIPMTILHQIDYI